MIHRLRLAILKKRIRNNPHIGKEDIDKARLYKNGGYSIRYRIINLPGGRVSVEWLSLKRRLAAYEEKIIKIKKRFLNFWRYQKWILLFRPAFIFILITVFLLFYFTVMETQKANVERIKMIVASVVGVTPEDVQYVGDGWLEISGRRRRRVVTITEPPRYEYEPIKYTFNPFRWLFFSESGFIRRWRSESTSYATHPVVYNERGDVWLRKKNSWVHGHISDEAIKWDTPQLGGFSLKKTSGHKISIEDKKLRIIDK